MNRAQVKRLSKIAKELHGKREIRMPVVRYLGVRRGQVYVTNQHEHHIEPIQGVPDCVLPPGAIHILASLPGSDETELLTEAHPGPLGHDIVIYDPENEKRISADGLPLDEFPFREEAAFK